MLRHIACVAVVVFLSAAPVFGQGASIIGQVTDGSGGVLPGVTVTATSPALQVPQVTDVTNEQGEYRLAPLPVGTYEVVFDLAGFSPARRQDIRLTVGFIAKIDVELGVGALAETVTVSGQAPVVDVTSTSQTTMLTNDQLNLTATSQTGAMSLLTMAPGVRSFLDVGGNQIMENPQAGSFGQGGGEWYTLDGIASGGGGAASAFFDFQTFDEVRVQSLGGDAEAPTRGVQLNIIVKSGGNEFHGSGGLSGANQSFQGSNIDQELRDVGITQGDALDMQYEVKGDLGGRIVRDKLWFYTAAVRREVNYDILGCFQESRFGVLVQEGTPCQTLNNQNTWTSKVSYQATPGNKFIFLGMWDHKKEDKGSSALVAWETREAKRGGHPHSKIEWEGVRGNAIARLQLGYSEQEETSAVLGSGLGRSDLDTEQVTGDNVVAGELSYGSDYHTLGSVAWYKPDWGYGNHEFKTGFDYVASANLGGLDQPQNYHLVYASGVPEQVAFFNTPVVPGGVDRFFGIYLKDSWTLARRLTLNLGVRYSHEWAFVPGKCREAAKPPSSTIFPAQCFNEVAAPNLDYAEPRMHAAYDLSGDGRTSLKGGWGRFHAGRGGAGRYQRNTVTYAVFEWDDLNGNNDWDLGESSQDVNDPTQFLGFTGGEFNPLPSRFIVNPGPEKIVLFDEFSATFEHQLAANMSVRVTGVASLTRNTRRTLNIHRPPEAYNIPITNQDPGPDGEVGTGDDGGLVTYFEYPVALAGAANQEFMTVTDTRGNQNFKSIDLSFVRRLANRWQLTASYSATKKHMPIGQVGRAAASGFGSASPNVATATQDLGPFTPNNEINASDNTWEWDGKVTATYVLPGAVSVSGLVHHSSGNPFARQVRFTGGETIPSIVLNVDPIGSYRRPHVNLVNFRVEKSFSLPRAHKVGVRFNLYNAMNFNTATGVVNRSGEDFLKPLSIMPPRLAELGMTYTF